MQSLEHKQHLVSRVSHNDCQECRADCERQFLPSRWPEYKYVKNYLDVCKAGFADKGIQLSWAGSRLDADGFRREFMTALHRRISLRVCAPQGRKFVDSYLERLGQFRRGTDAGYLRQFARRGASALT